MRYIRKFFVEIQDSSDLNLFFIGIFIVITHLFSLFSMPAMFLISVTMTVLLSVKYFLRAGKTSLFAGIPVIFGVLYWGIQFNNGEPFNWDVASYELPNYFDFMDRTKGAYSTYALIPSSFFGMAERFNELGIEYIYGFSILIFATSLCAIISLLPSQRQIVFSIIVAVLLTTAFQTLFHVGKGDLMAATFTNFTLYSFFKYFKSNRNIQTTVLANLFLFSALTVCSKTGLVLIVAPFVGLCLLDLVIRRDYFLVFNKKIFLSIVFSVLAFYSFLAKMTWWGLSSLIDDSNLNEHVLKTTIYKNIIPYFINGYRSAYFLPILLLSIFIFSFAGLFISRSKRYPLFSQLVAWIIFSTAIIFMPYAVLLGPQSIENMRLVAMPLTSLIFIGML